MTFSYCECGRSSAVEILVLCPLPAHIPGDPGSIPGYAKVFLASAPKAFHSSCCEYQPTMYSLSSCCEYQPTIYSHSSFIPHSLCCEYQPTIYSHSSCCEYQPTIYSHSSCCVYQPTMYSQLKRQNGSVASTNLQCTPYRRAASTSLQCTPNQRNLSHPGAPIAMK